MIINDLNRGYLAEKNASLLTGNYGAFLILTTWNPNPRYQNRNGLTNAYGLNQPDIGTILSLILAANSSNGHGMMSPLFMHLGNNRAEQNPPTINQALPPIIEKNVDRDGNPNTAPISEPTHFGIGQGVVPYQPKFSNIQNVISSPKQEKNSKISNKLKVAGEKEKDKKIDSPKDVQVNRQSPLPTLENDDQQVNKSKEEVNLEDKLSEEESELDWEDGENNA